jgi:hypothetical protein
MVGKDWEGEWNIGKGRAEDCEMGEEEKKS